MDIEPPTDTELSITGPNFLLQSKITYELDYKPSLINYEYNDDNLFDSKKSYLI